MAHRLNERGAGDWSLSGELKKKKGKDKVADVKSEAYYEAQVNISLCRMLLDSGVVIYDNNIHPTVQHWIANGICVIVEREPTSIFSRKTIETAAVLVAEKRKDVELVMGLLIEFYPRD